MYLDNSRMWNDEFIDVTDVLYIGVKPGSDKDYSDTASYPITE